MAEVRARKMRVQAEADAAEAEFNRIRFAAGVQQAAAPGSPTTGDASSRTLTVKSSGAIGSAPDAEEGASELDRFAEPRPDVIIARFATLEMEMKQIAEQVTDYRLRLHALQQRYDYLQAAKQPRARDASDEVDTDILVMDTLQKRADVAKRAADTARAELRNAESIKMQLHQSLLVLSEYVLH
ncbi:hypothetical protein EON66_03675 [archaeon]|nr:MAG: hypothetical protein EON66_03675 [archaeon]